MAATHSLVSSGPKGPKYTFPHLDDDEEPGVMTLRRLQRICEKHDLYRTPEVNDKLYLHYEGFRTVDPEVMARYCNLKCLWLQGNGLSEISGLDACGPTLKSLYLHENAIAEIGDGLRAMVEVETLNLSKTFLTRLSGLEGCAKLSTLNLGYCNLGPDAAAVEHAATLPRLSTLDVQHNKLEDGEGMLALAARMPALRVLYCQGNPFVREFRYYRKRFISAGDASKMDRFEPSSTPANTLSTSTTASSRMARRVAAWPRRRRGRWSAATSSSAR